MFAEPAWRSPCGDYTLPRHSSAGSGLYGGAASNVAAMPVDGSDAVNGCGSRPMARRFSSYKHVARFQTLLGSSGNAGLQEDRRRAQRTAAFRGSDAIIPSVLIGL